ncbi:short-chain dehydrogenase [Paenibacillus baekrokdamisoli]|uniref:Short-chain dehydrogenase n=1 Tax=Paenibacillus baekrokdamisoli TaxID=1712516 RepID=A0A3G9J608_9BACL|nr:glucose 1-dehydrogenase [Paenibacillus baekrokdamisoli]MBB3073449.1 dihydroanticapsin dehydrogenase [Paenibacillus baekrokdamisoli]BBH20243.1 short-chain dehydrogenase [Paenibacillus baekrokdamisoli]
MKRFADQVVIVTGAASGIGEATARLFAAEGAKVAAVDINEDGLRRLANDFDASHNGEIVPFVCDLIRSADVEKMVGEIAVRWGRIDVLFNNAGIEETDSITNTTEEMWDRQITVNLKSVFLCSKYVIPHMQKTNGGKIINAGSIEGIVAEPNGAAYVASKGAIVLLTKEMALSYAKDNIRVNCVCPGWIDTGMAKRSIDKKGGIEVMLPEIQRLQPLGRLGQPEEVGRSVLFLASDDSSFITGISLMVDGGYTAQ